MPSGSTAGCSSERGVDFLERRAAARRERASRAMSEARSRERVAPAPPPVPAGSPEKNMSTGRAEELRGAAAGEEAVGATGADSAAGADCGDPAGCAAAADGAEGADGAGGADAADGAESAVGAAAERRAGCAAGAGFAGSAAPALGIRAPMPRPSPRFFDMLFLQSSGPLVSQLFGRRVTPAQPSSQPAVPPWSHTAQVDLVRS